MVNHAANAYQQVSVQSGAAFADPHSLIVMLFDGALERIAKAKGAIMQQDVAGKGKLIGEAISIIGGLKGSLKMDENNEISNNLAELYDYMSRRLLEANMHNDATILQEVSSLLLEIKSAWVAIPQDVRNEYAQKKAVS